MKDLSVKVLAGMVVLSLICAWLISPAGVRAAEIKMAFGDLPSMDTIADQAAIVRLQQRGIPIKPIYFKSDQLANQAVIGGECEIGSGTPYGIIQRMNKEKKIELRFVYQRMINQYMPLVRKSKYKTWKDLNGQEMVVHARASGTEAQAKMAEKIYGVKFSQLKYVPGTEVRGNAMLQGTIDASIVGIFTANMLMERQPGQWIILPLEGVAGTDDAVYTRMDWLAKNEEIVRMFIRESLLVNRRLNADYTYAEELRNQYKLLPDLPKEIEAQIPIYYKIAAQRELYPLNGGINAAKTDLEFYHVAGQLEGSLEDLKVEDFWHLKSLKDVLQEIGEIKVEHPQ
jgi:ABC-type nitrate/sulfonate/bicarbonate transport system substrate-binding protein